MELPYSKSMVNRALMIAAVSGQDLLALHPYCDARDSEELFHALNSNAGDINSGEGATPHRFLIAYRAASQLTGSIHVTGTMRQRKTGAIVEALNLAGADVRTQDGYPPTTIVRGLPAFRELSVNTAESSQALSALMLIAPMFPGTKTFLTGKDMVSSSYARLTAAMMHAAGIHIRLEPNRIIIEEGTYSYLAPRLGRDWSSAAFWMAMCCIHPGLRLEMSGLKADGLQPDEAALDKFSQLGLTHLFTEEGLLFEKTAPAMAMQEVDFRDCPDLAPAWLVAAACSGIQATISGTSHLKHKESDRMRLMAHGLAQWNVCLEEREEGIWLDARKFKPAPVQITTGHDHRIAMAFAVAACVCEVTLDDSDCIAKSYPEFLNELKACNLNLKTTNPTYGR